MATLRGCPERWCARGERGCWSARRRLAAVAPEGWTGATGDDADTPALALACEVALDIDGGARCKVADVGKVDAAQDDPVTVDPLAERISLGEQDETEVAGGADGSGPAADQANQTDPIHRFSASASMASWSFLVVGSTKAVGIRGLAIVDMVTLGAALAVAEGLGVWSSATSPRASPRRSEPGRVTSWW